jgi:hypothetical protein
MSCTRVPPPVSESQGVLNFSFEELRTSKQVMPNYKKSVLNRDSVTALRDKLSHVLESELARFSERGGFDEQIINAGFGLLDKKLETSQTLTFDALEAMVFGEKGKLSGIFDLGSKQALGTIIGMADNVREEMWPSIESAFLDVASAQARQGMSKD